MFDKKFRTNFRLFFPTDKSPESEGVDAGRGSCKLPRTSEARVGTSAVGQITGELNRLIIKLRISTILIMGCARSSQNALKNIFPRILLR